MGVDRVLFAVFAEDTSPPIVVGTVQVAAGQESAVVTWSSNQPMEAWLEFGTVGTPLVNRVDSVSPGALSGAPPVVLSGLTPDEAYDFQITVANLNGRLATGVLETPLRDDFNTCDPADVLATWSLIDPVGDAVFRVEGGGTADAFAVLEVPPGVSHPANATNLPPRIERAIGRSLFEHEVFMASVPTQQTQLQGVLYRESDSDRWLGVFYQYVNGLVRYLVAFVGPDEPGGPATLKAIKSGPVNGSISSLGFRIERDLDQWRMRRSQNDGVVWQNMSQGFGPEKIPSDFAPDRVALLFGDLPPSLSLPAPGAIAAYDSIRTYDPTDAQRRGRCHRE